VGVVTNLLARSRGFEYATGVYGAGRSRYQNFLTRGHEVVFPKNTAMVIGIGTRAAADTPAASAQLSSANSGVGQ
jgi:hypothetical protein